MYSQHCADKKMVIIVKVVMMAEPDLTVSISVKIETSNAIWIKLSIHYKEMCINHEIYFSDHARTADVPSTILDIECVENWCMD